VRALALVHHYLYESEDVRVVELRLFVGELCQVLHDTLSGAGRQIRIEADVHNITIPSERAVPIALLITEAVTNAYKHAFPDGRAGKISVAIHTLDETSALLTIGDDGVGYNVGEDLPTAVVAGQGVGMSLISAFARQLGEELEVSGSPGTTISLRLRLQAKPEAEDAAVDTADSEATSAASSDTAAASPSAPPSLGAEARSFGKA
jgi:two-component sensor histidine kinase